MQQPRKAGRVLTPTEPWESWAVFGYNHVLRAPDGEARLYYDCIQGSGVPPSSALAAFSQAARSAAGGGALSGSR